MGASSMFPNLPTLKRAPRRRDARFREGRCGRRRLLHTSRAAPLPTADALVVRTVRAMSTQIPGYATKYTILKTGEGAAVAKGKTVTVHATGVVKETGKTFWSTKDPDQEPFTYQAGVGQVITGWDQGILGMMLGTPLLHASTAPALSTGAPCMRRRAARADHPGARGLRCQGLPRLGHPARRHASIHAGGAQHRVRPAARSWWRGQTARPVCGH